MVLDNSTIEAIKASAPILQSFATLISVIVGSLFGYWLTKKEREPILDVITGEVHRNGKLPLKVANLGDYPVMIRNLGYQKNGTGEIKQRPRSKQRGMLAPSHNMHEALSQDARLLCRA